MGPILQKISPPTDRIHGSRNQAVKGRVPPITIIPSNPPEEFILPALESMTFKVLVPGRPVLSSKDTNNPSKLKAVATIQSLWIPCVGRPAAKESSYHVY